MAALPEKPDDPRIYMAAERTLLAWIRTGIALMAFGFVVARLGVSLREMALLDGGAQAPVSGPSVYLGLGMICFGVLVCLVSSMRHQGYVRAIDEGRFRQQFGSTFAFVVVGVVSLLAVAMAVLLLRF